MSLGLNFQLESRHDSLTKKWSWKNCISQITNEASKNNIQINDDERLRCEIKRFGLRVPGCRYEDVLIKEQYGLIKTFASRVAIIVRKSDKSKYLCIYGLHR